MVTIQTQAQAVQSNTLTGMGLDRNKYMFDAFQRSGASLAISLNMPVQFIKAHGTWTSYSVWQYLEQTQYPLMLTATMSDFLTTT